MRIPCLLIALLLAAPAAHARPLFEGRTTSAGRTDLVSGDARIYARARWQYRNGQSKRAIQTLEAHSVSILDDRVALLRAKALRRLGKKEEAKAQYVVAFERAGSRAVAIDAAKGLVDLLGHLGRHDERLPYLDALLADPELSEDMELKFERALSLSKLGRKDEASKEAKAVVVAYPSEGMVHKAMRILRSNKKKGAPRVSRNRLALYRIQFLLGKGRLGSAGRELSRLKPRSRSVRARAEILRADLALERKNRALEAHHLRRALKIGRKRKKHADIPELADALLRLGRYELARRDEEGAKARFSEILKRFPASAEAVEAGSLMDWVFDHSRRLPGSARELLYLSHEHDDAWRRAETRWLAGWTAYLAHDDSKAETALLALVGTEDTEIDLKARYWLGRLRHRSGDLDGAARAYRGVLEQAPMTYYGYWAKARLDQIGAMTLPEGCTEIPFGVPVEEAAEFLGPDRPMAIDRAILLSQARVGTEALEELYEADEHYARIDDGEGRAVVADLMEAFGFPGSAYVLSKKIAEEMRDASKYSAYALRVWRRAFPERFPTEVRVASRAHEVSPYLVLSIARTESQFNPSAVSAVGARGVMQLMPGTARMIGRAGKRARRHARSYKKPASNIWLGAHYFAELMDRYKGNYILALGAYNAGPGAMDRWLRQNQTNEVDELVESIPYGQTRGYIRKNVKSYFNYLAIYGKAQPTLTDPIPELPRRKKRRGVATLASNP